MLRPISTEWPIWHGDAWHAPQAREVRPMYHELALAHYLEEQAARRASSIREVTLWTLVSALDRQIGQISSGIRRLFSRAAGRRTVDLTGSRSGRA
jgi:hypothetical protein